MALAWTRHARERMAERNLLMSDILHVLKNGFVYDAPQPSTRPGFYRYAMQAQTPNSGNREVRVIVIPDPAGCGSLKIVTVMWVDETS